LRAIEDSDLGASRQQMFDDSPADQPVPPMIKTCIA